MGDVITAALAPEVTSPAAVPPLALSDSAASLIQGADLADLHRLRFAVHDTYNFSFGGLTEQSFERIVEDIPILTRLVDLETVRSRLKGGTVTLQTGFPELNELYNRCGETIASATLRPAQKADAWIRAVATDAGADVSAEAATYLARRGFELSDIPRLVGERWQSAILRDAAHGRGSEEQRARAQAHTLTLEEVAASLGDTLWSPRFM